MAHIARLEEAELQRPTLVTIGVYDGVHRGHQALIREFVEMARQAGQQTVVITFFPHPDAVLRDINGRYYLTTPQVRADLLQDLGVDLVVTHPFDDAIRQMRAAAFVDRLRTYLDMRQLWVGEDFALGYQREGTVAFLQQQGEHKGFSVRPVRLVTQSGSTIITSTLIREKLQAGDMAAVGDLLGRPYQVEGPVQHGDKRGRQIGFPTANIGVWDQQMIPRHGVYAGWLTIGGERYKAVTNIGVRPTFAGDDVTVEAHILDFDREIYNTHVHLTLEAFLRPERKFDGLPSLVAQLEKDVAQARAYLDANTSTGSSPTF